jgi:hypothetical protein
MNDGVSGVLAEVSDTMLDEGMELRLDGLEGGTARVRLDVDPAACEDCVVPGSVIEGILLPRLREHLPALERVELVGQMTT